MNKTSWIIIVSVLIAIGVSGFFFNKFFLLTNGRVVSRTTQEYVILKDELSESAKVGDTNKQIEVAEKIVSLQKNDDDSKLDLANAYLEKASLDFKEKEYGEKGLALAKEVIAHDSNNYNAYLAEGYAYEVLQDYENSIFSYNKAIEINPNYDLSYVKRGHAYDLSGDLSLAEDDYSKALELNEKNDVALMNLARIFQRREDFENAADFAKQAIEVSKIAFIKATCYEIIGLADMNSNDYKSAIDNFTNSINSYEKYANAYTNRAYAKIILAGYVVKDYALKSDINADLSKSLEMNPGSSFVKVVEGILKQSSGDKNGAIESYNQALLLVDNDITLGVSEKEIMKQKINQSIINNK